MPKPTKKSSRKEILVETTYFTRVGGRKGKKIKTDRTILKTDSLTRVTR